MSIPIGIFQLELLLAFALTAYGIFGHDENNYTDSISIVLSVIMWFLCGISMLVGIHSDGVDYVGVWLAWVFIAIAIIVGILAFVKVIDTLRLHRSQGHVDMNFDPRL